MKKKVSKIVLLVVLLGLGFVVKLGTAQNQQLEKEPTLQVDN